MKMKQEKIERKDRIEIINILKEREENGNTENANYKKNNGVQRTKKMKMKKKQSQKRKKMFR